MRTVDVTLAGQPLHLMLNAAAMFEIQDTFGADAELMPLLEVSGAQGLENVCTLLEILGRQGELYRRYLGHAPGSMPDEGALALTLRPREALQARGALLQAFAAGLLQEEGERPKEIDKGLLELQKKTKNP